MRIVHLTDLHVGMEKQGWLWPTAKRALLEDLTKLHAKAGEINLVIFSGDLTQKATPDEFNKLTTILEEVWKTFNSLGSNPLLFPIPGNHDLERPKAMNPVAHVMKRWWDSEDIQKAFWQKEPGDYQELIEKAFTSYKNWLTGLENSSIPLAKLATGILPGDVASEIKVGDLTLGLIGLNTAWLQLDGSEFRQKLSVDARQLMALTKDDPDGWCGRHDFNFIVTHHPQEWLHPTSLDLWRSEIYTPSRFDCHLYGHMHIASTQSTAESGGKSRRHIQGASLFGLETHSGTNDRTHGYSVLEIYRASNENRRIRQWPRRAHKGHSGEWKIIADPDFDYDDQESVEYNYSLNQSPPAKLSDTSIGENSLLRPAPGNSSLRTLRKTLPDVRAFAGVRDVEKELGTKALSAKRALWIASDWGLGEDQFVRTLQLNQPVEQSFIYKLDCQNFHKRKDIYIGVQEQIGCSFEQLCEQLSLEAPCILALDDIPILEGIDNASQNLQQDIQFIVDLLLEYCPNIRIIVKSRRLPERSTLEVVELHPFDEADTAAYIAAHELGGVDIANPKVVRQLFQHTDGIPVRIDRALQDAQIVGIENLPSLDSDVAGKSAATLAAPSGLAETLNQLGTSKDPTTARAFKLLKVLAMFPRGEQLATIKRFYSTSQFYLQDARILLNAALLDAVEIPNIDADQSESARALVVRRTVREYWYASLPSNELSTLNKQSLALYFGSNWSTKGIQPQRHMRFNDPRCGSWQIGNASMLVLRAARESVNSRSGARQNNARDLASAYCASLMSGNHYQAVISLCEDLLPIFEELEAPIHMPILQEKFAAALRIVGQYERAIKICERLLSTKPSKLISQSAHLTLAQCYRALKQPKEAAQYAQTCIQLEPKNNYALHAKAIAASIDEENPNREKNLRQIESQARKRNAHVVANNIAMELAYECKDDARRREYFAETSEQSLRDGDHHNATRSIVEIATIHLNDTGSLTPKMLGRLIGTYHYLYREDLQRLFESCHAVLWRAFEIQGSIENLLRLFRYSSLRWRVRGLESIETDYISRLGELIKGKNYLDFEKSVRELAYFAARTSRIASSSKS